MKISLYTLLFLCSISFLQAQNVNIPDANFKAALVADVLRVNTNGDSEIQLSEAQAALVVSVNNKGITDLTGIEEFINVGGVAFDDNAVTTADLSALTKMSLLYCRNNQLTSLLIPTNNTALTFLYAQNNQLTSLDLTNALDTLRELNLSYNQLTSIDLSSLDIDISRVTLDYNQLTNITFPNINTIPFITCSHNQLNNFIMPLSAGYLDCGNNPMDSFWMQNSFGSGVRIDCDSSQLRHISFINDFDSIICSYNDLTKLNLASNQDFNYIDCRNNNIDSIRLSYSRIEYLNASNNQLTKLGIYGSNANNNFPLDATNNPNLRCIETFQSISNANANWIKDPQATIANFCSSIWSSVNFVQNLSNISIYPNPTGGIVQLDLGQLYEEISISVYSTLGQRMNSYQLKSQHQIDLLLPDSKGVYLIKVQTEQGQAVLKAIRE